MKPAKVVMLLIAAGRIVVGLAIMYAGVQLIRGDGLLSFSYSQFDSITTGLFVIVIGFLCILAALRPAIFD